MMVNNETKKLILILSVFWVILLLTACGGSPTDADSNANTTSTMEPVTNFKAVAGDRQVSLSWSNPNGADYVGTLIIRKTGSFPKNRNDGIQVFNGRDINFVDKNLTNDITYYYAAYTFDVVGNYSASVTVSSTPVSDNINVILISISGGMFQMGQVGVAELIHQVTVRSFQMSANEITNSQYVLYLNTALAAGEIAATVSSVSGKGGDYSGQEYINLSGRSDSNNRCWISYDGISFSVSPGKENWPVVYVTWYGAKAFAVKYGMDLPREAEWEYASRGDKGYEYGTADGTISSSNANFSSNVGYPIAVGSYRSNPFGLYDMAGNVMEWCSDWYGSYSRDDVTDPQGPPTGSSRVIRGGSWFHGSGYCRSASRYYSPPYDRASSFGFRVVLR